MKTSRCKHSNNGFFDGPLILKPEIFKDPRGSFLESWNLDRFNNLLNTKTCFVQDNQSISAKGVFKSWLCSGNFRIYGT